MDICSALFASFSRLDALAVNNRRTGLGLPPGLLADSGDQGGVESVPQPPVAPPPVISLDCLPRGKVVGQQPPRLPTAHEVENGIENLPVRPGAWAAPATRVQREQGGQAAPLFIVQIRWICTSGLGFHPPRLLALFTKRFLRARGSAVALQGDDPWAARSRRYHAGQPREKETRGKCLRLNLSKLNGFLSPGIQS